MSSRFTVLNTTLQKSPPSLGIAWSLAVFILISCSVRGYSSGLCFLGFYLFLYFNLFQYEAAAAVSVSWDCLIPTCFYTAILFSTRLKQRPLFLGILPVFILQSFSVRGYSSGLSLLGLPGLGLGTGKRKKSWTRAVFSNLQRKGKI